MAKAKFDFKSIEVPAAAQKPLYAGVGAGDLAVTAVKEYVADVQKRVTGAQKDVETRVADVQKTVTGFDPKAVRATAVSAAKARRAAVEARVAELQAEARSLPTKVQTTVNDNVATVTGTVLDTYGDLAKRGEAVVRGTKLPSTATVEVKVNETRPSAKKAPVRKPATKPAAKPTAKKPTATKAPAKKATAKKAPAAKTTASSTTATTKA
jgi:polyhydroxyalkanoate synthesis regulator phasin